MMNIRFPILFLLAVLGSLLGAWLARLPGAFVGVWISIIAWSVWDAKQGRVVLRWLSRPRKARIPKVFGFWLQAIEAVQREIKRLNAKIKDREAQLNNFLGAIQDSPDGVILLNENSCIEWCNHTAAFHFGINAQRDRLQYVGNLLRDPAFIRYYLKEDYSHDALVPGHNDSPLHPLQLQVQLHSYGKGCKLLLSRDVTVLQQVEVMRRDFIANVSHEIKTPLTVLAGFAETLQSTNVTPGEQKHFLDLMQQQSTRLQTLVEDLLTLSKLEGSPLPNPNTWIDLGELMSVCEEEARSLSRIWSKGAQTLCFPMPDADYSIRGSKAELRSAIENLLSNAIRYAPLEGKIEAHWKANVQGGLTFSVHDNGPGIAPEHLAKLAQRFYRVDQSRSRETGGTGLGLAIVKQILQRHSAELSIHSVEGRGATFSMVFPASCIAPLNV